MTDDQPVKPANILNIVATNQGHRPLTLGTPSALPLSPERVKELMAEGCAIVDTRSSVRFGEGHIVGAFNVQMASKEFEQRVGWIVPDDTPVILLTETSADAQKCVYNMGFIALDRFVMGYLEGGIKAWTTAGYPVGNTVQMDPTTIRDRLQSNTMAVLDVRDEDEWAEFHIVGAHLMPYTSLAPQLDVPAQLDQLNIPLDQELAVTCATGNRSSIAISMLQRHGYTNLYNMTGGMEGWANAELPTVNGAGEACQI